MSYMYNKRKLIIALIVILHNDARVPFPYSLTQSIFILVTLLLLLLLIIGEKG